MLFLVLALPKLNIGTKNQYEIFHVPLPLNQYNKRVYYSYVIRILPQMIILK